MLTEAQNANMITFWLTEWIRLGATIPCEFVSDMSLALLNAGVRAFAKESSIREYINTVFCLVNGRGNQPVSSKAIPSCFIWIDLAHLMKNVVSCKPIRRVPFKVRDFFIRCVAILAKMDSLAKAKRHIEAVLIVAYSQSEGEQGSTNNI